MAKKVQRTYETVIAYQPDLSEEEVAAYGQKVQEIINAHGGVAGPVRYWGKFRTAYRINKHTHAHYTHVVYTANHDTTLELERNLKIWDDVIRFLTVRISDKPKSEEELAKLSQEAVIPSPEDIIVSEIEEFREIGVYTGGRPEAAAEPEPEPEPEAETQTEKEAEKETEDADASEGDKE